MNHYLIVGNGVAGVKAAETIRQHDPHGQITMLSNENYPFYRRPQLPSYAAGKITEAQLTARSRDFYKHNKIELILGTSVTQVNPQERLVKTDVGKTYFYDILLLATGCSLAPINVPGADKTDDVVKLMTLDDAQRIRQKLRPGQRAAVVGEGFLAAALVDALLTGDMKVVYILSTDRFWPQVLDVDASRIMELRLQQRGVEIIKNASIAEAVVKSGAITGLRLSNGELVRCELLGLAGPMRPNIGFLTGSGVRIDSGIVVDAQMRTNLQGIYAAGDVTQMADIPMELPRINVRWLKAWRQGQVAGANMCGEDQRYDEYACFSSTRVAGVDLVAIGISNPFDGGFKVMRGDYPHPDIDVYKKLVLKDDRVVGALLIGDVSEASEIHRAIHDGKKVDDLDESLLKQMFDLNYPVTRYKGVVCPVCKLMMSLIPGAKAGDTLTCPACGIEFTLTQAMLASR